MDYLQNLHTHTVFCDGKDTPEQLVERALSLGHTAIGFSGHSYMFYSNYISLEKTLGYRKEVEAVKQKYADRIEVYCGLEFDLFSEVDLTGYDYIIGSEHYLYRDGKYIAFDRSAAEVKQVIDEYFGGDGLSYAKAYYETLSLLPKKAKCDIIGHFDIVAKHAEKANFFDENDKKYQSYALDAMHALRKDIPILEINTGAIARGYRTTPYPAPFLLKEWKAIGGEIIISSDCHDKAFLNYRFNEAVEYAKSCGFNEAAILSAGKFRSVKL